MGHDVDVTSSLMFETVQPWETSRPDERLPPLPRVARKKLRPYFLSGRKRSRNISKLYSPKFTALLPTGGGGGGGGVQEPVITLDPPIILY